MQSGDLLRKITFSFALCLLFALTAQAETISIVGNSTGGLSTATVTCTFNPMTNTLTLTITNTSRFDARITGIGFDLVQGDFSGNGSSGLNGFSGANNAGFTFGDGALGNVPQFGNAVLDFGWTTGNSGNFSGGSPNDGIAPGSSLTLSVSGSAFAGLTEAQICQTILVRFQRVGADGEGSDVATPSQPVPEPTSMLLLGSGLVGLGGAARRKLQARNSN